MSTIFGIDVETTGLFPPEKNRILEIGITAIDEPSFTEIESWSTVIFYEAGEIGPLMNDFVLTMHQENGLLAEMGEMATGKRPKVLMRQALLEALAFVNRHAVNCGTDDRGKPEVFMMGANPDFDRRYLESWMPDLMKRFHYRVFDVNTLFLLRRFILGGPHAKFGTAHRVLADNRQALQGIHDFVQSFAAAVGEVHLKQIAELENQVRELRATRDADAAVSADRFGRD